MAADLEPYEGQSCEWTNLPCHLSSFAEWLLDLLLFIPRKVFELFMDAAAAAIEAIPVPDWVSSASSGLSNIPPGVVFFADFLQLPAGIAIILSAYGIRFLIRRIPVIG